MVWLFFVILRLRVCGRRDTRQSYQNFMALSLVPVSGMFRLLTRLLIAEKFGRCSGSWAQHCRIKSATGEGVSGVVTGRSPETTARSMSSGRSLVGQALFVPSNMVHNTMPYAKTSIFFACFGTDVPIITSGGINPGVP